MEGMLSLTPVNSMASRHGPTSLICIGQSLQTFAHFVRHFLPNTDRLIPRKIWAKAVFPQGGAYRGELHNGASEEVNHELGL